MPIRWENPTEETAYQVSQSRSPLRSASSLNSFLKAQSSQEMSSSLLTKHKQAYALAAQIKLSGFFIDGFNSFLCPLFLYHPLRIHLRLHMSHLLGHTMSLLIDFIHNNSSEKHFYIPHFFIRNIFNIFHEGANSVAMRNEEYRST